MSNKSKLVIKNKTRLYIETNEGSFYIGDIVEDNKITFRSPLAKYGAAALVEIAKFLDKLTLKDEK